MTDFKVADLSLAEFKAAFPQQGQITFRGNPTRSYYGLGPVPKNPKVLWRYPESGGMCGSSPVGGTISTKVGVAVAGRGPGSARRAWPPAAESLLACR